MTHDVPPDIGETRWSPWVMIDQALIDRFADVTGDHQFIHGDPERAAGTMFGGTIAHGFLLLSLVGQLHTAITPPPAGTIFCLNYGMDRLRFLRAVRSGSRVRLASTLTSLQEKERGGFQAHFAIAVEQEDAEKPALVADWIVRYLLSE